MNQAAHAWIDRIHTRLLARYGSRWLAMWDEIHMADVREDWFSQLEDLSQRRVDYALANLPQDFPPNAAQFRAIALRCPYQAQPALAAPPANPQRLAEELGRLKALREDLKTGQWAHELRAREKAGESLTLAQQAAWRSALRELPAEAIGPTMVFNAIPHHMLPPQMQADIPNPHPRGERP